MTLEEVGSGARGAGVKAAAAALFSSNFTAKVVEAIGMESFRGAARRRTVEGRRGSDESLTLGSIGLGSGKDASPFTSDPPVTPSAGTECRGREGGGEGGGAKES